MPIDLLLINPPSRGSYGFLEEARDTRSPLGLGYIAAYVEKRKYSVKILDFDAEKMVLDNFIKLLPEFRPGIVGLSCTTPTIMTVIDIANNVKNYDENILVIAGGPHVSALPEETLQRSKIDIVVRGEGEFTTVEILEYLKGKIELSEIKGISYKNNGKIIHNPDRKLFRNIDLLSFPARHLLPMDRYRTNNYLEAYGDKFANIMATRGCPYRCIFCGQDIIFKHTVRVRTAKKIVDELEEISKNFGIKVFSFEDSTFTFNPKLVEETCQEILSRGLKIKWGTMGRADLTDKELYQIMRKAGCILIFYGIESGNQHILNRARKNITLDQARKAVKVVKKAGIPVNTSFILGLPGENKDTIMETINFAIELNPDYATFSLATPYPGTEFYDIAIKEEIDLSDWNKFRLARYSDPLYVPKSLTSEELKFYHRLAYKKFYLRPGYMFKSLFKIRTIGDLIHKIQIVRGLVK